MITLRNIIIIILLTIMIPAANTAKADTIPADTFRISLITCSPGSDVYELCGHTALRITHGNNDMAVNYGIFDFDSPNFLYRFVKGETDYMVAAYPFAMFLNDYARHGRGVIEQPLNLNQQQAERLVKLIEENLRPENRVYRYNYVKDNCSTRPLTMIERAIGDTLTMNVADEWHAATFRDAMRRFHANYPWYQFGIDIALGSGIDYRISSREHAFAPVILSEMMKTATIPDSSGTGHPAISTTVTLLQPLPECGPQAPTHWWATPMAMALIVLLGIILITVRDLRRKKITRWADAILMTVNGLGGCLLAFLIFVSVHEATSPNYLFLWLNPLCLIVPVCIYIKSCSRLLKYYEMVNFVALFLLCVLWPWLGQSGNPAFLPLVLGDAILTVRYIIIIQCATKRQNRVRP